MSSLVHKEESIKTFAWNEHIRIKPEMYIGGLGDGSKPDDGLYTLLKEVIDNSIHEFTAGFGKEIILLVSGEMAAVRDFGRGIPFESVVGAVGTLKTGGRSDGSTNKEARSLNGFGTKIVNALSQTFYVCSYRNGEKSWAYFSRGELLKSGRGLSDERDGTFVIFSPDPLLFTSYSFKTDYVRKMIRNYTQMNSGITLALNDTSYKPQMDRLLEDFLGSYSEGQGLLNDSENWN